MYALSAYVNRSHENSDVPFSREFVFTGTFSFQFIILIIFSALEGKKGGHPYQTPAYSLIKIEMGVMNLPRFLAICCHVTTLSVYHYLLLPQPPTCNLPRESDQVTKCTISEWQNTNLCLSRPTHHFLNHW